MKPSEWKDYNPSDEVVNVVSSSSSSSSSAPVRGRGAVPITNGLLGVFTKAMSRVTRDEPAPPQLPPNPQTRVVTQNLGEKRKAADDTKERDLKIRRHEDGITEENRKGLGNRVATKTHPVIYWQPLSDEEAERRNRKLLEPKDTICYAFRDSGFCKRGDTCRFEHVVQAPSLGNDVADVENSPENAAEVDA